jgi:hypothetical protein
MVASVEMARVLQAGVERALKWTSSHFQRLFAVNGHHGLLGEVCTFAGNSMCSFGLVSMLRPLGSMLVSVADVFQVLEGNRDLMIRSADHFPRPAEADASHAAWRTLELKLDLYPNADGQGIGSGEQKTMTADVDCVSGSGEPPSTTARKKLELKLKRESNRLTAVTQAA